MKLSIFVLSILFFGHFSFAAATAPESDLKVFGDAYYSYNMNSPIPQQNEYRSYDVAHNSFELNQIGLQYSKALKDFSFVSALDFGPQADIMNGTGNARNISQLYVTLKPALFSGWSVDLGKFLTHIGFETPYAKDNWNYSRSLAYTYGTPTWHGGGRINAPQMGPVSMVFLLVNGWGDASTGDIEDNNKSKSLGAQIKFTLNDQVAFLYNGMTGAEKANNNHDSRNVHEFIASVQTTDAALLAFDFVMGDEENENDPGNTVSNNRAKSKWQSIGLYGQFRMTPIWTLSPRIELYTAEEDPGNVSLTNGGTEKDETVTSLTFTAQQQLGEGLSARYEFRSDTSDFENAFQDGATDTTDSQTTFTAALLFNF